MRRHLQVRGLDPQVVDGAKSVAELLARCASVYSTRGLESLRGIPDASVDFVWSHAVLGHIRSNEFLPIQRELRRILRRDGVCSHRVDLMDHLGGGLNNLRFSQRFWETDWLYRSGLYNNRIRYGRMLKLFEQAGFQTEVVQVDRWTRLPITRSRLAAEFRGLSDHELSVSAFDVLLRPC